MTDLLLLFVAWDSDKDDVKLGPELKSAGRQVHFLFQAARLNKNLWRDSCVQFLEMVHVPKDDWFVSAQNRDNWQDQIKSMTSFNRQPPQVLRFQFVFQI